MVMHRKRDAVYLVLLLVVLSACGSNSQDKKYEPERAQRSVESGLVAPLQNDTRPEIVSWVDGQVVTDWPAEITKRDAAIERYLNDADAGHAAKYGFRSGQTPQMAW